MSKKAWIIFAAVCVAFLGGLIYFSSMNRTNVDTVDLNAILAPAEQSGNIGDHVFGNKDAKVILVEYGDFQCPGCGNVHPTVKELTEKYEDDVAFVFRNLPLTNIHPNARAAAAAAEAAGLQGKYWDMHNLLFESQSAWSNVSSSERIELFATYAKEVGINVETFKEDITSSAINQKINFDRALAAKANASATPAFFLDGKSLDNSTWNDPKVFEEAITTELRNQGVTPKE